jgi:glycosyltransferase involved in cell wall biosynthesis
VRPRLLYIGDLPVEDTHHSSAQLYRLLQTWPASALRVVETRPRPSAADRRLKAVAYDSLPIADPRGLRHGRRGLYSLWLCDSVSSRCDRFVRVAEEFGAEAVLTIGSGFGWLAAAEVARRLRLPLHFIAHDDWPKLEGIDRMFDAALRRRFEAVYRRARSRLCISPFMIEDFERRYGCSGTWLAPIRADGEPPAAPAPRPLGDDEVIVIGYGGGSGAHVMPGLEMLARAIGPHRARLMLYGPFTSARQAALRAFAPVTEFHGLVSSEAMMTGLLACDLLFVPMSFDADARDNMRVSFPSKLAEYTALGLPILVHAPAESSASRWARDTGAAAVSVVDDPEALRDTLFHLARDQAHRAQLSQRARAASAQFDAAAGRAVFEAAVLA